MRNAALPILSPLAFSATLRWRFFLELSMPNELTTFNTPANLGAFMIRVLELDGKPWFVAADVCRALGIVPKWDRMTNLTADERRVLERRDHPDRSLFPGSTA